MVYQSEYSSIRTLRAKFYDRRKESELMNDCINEALALRGVPITVTLSVAIYYAIRHGILKNKGLGSLMFKNMLCMGAGLCGSTLGIQGRYYDKLALFYTSCRYQEIRKLLQVPHDKNKNDFERTQEKSFVKPNYLNLDEIDNNNQREDIKNEWSSPFGYRTYEELQSKNRAAYALKWNTIY